MTVETRDILLKAAEDVQQGMWCVGSWFSGVDTEDTTSGEHTGVFSEPIDTLQSARRCAEGSIYLAARLLGGNLLDAKRAVSTVEKRLDWTRGECYQPSHHHLWHYNDSHLPDDPFEAGQQLAELFRTTAEVL